MARQTSYHAHQKRNQSKGNGQLLMIVIAFATGYMSSTVFDMNHLSQSFNQSLSKVFPKVNPKLETPAPNMHVAHQPKLEFYTVLAKQTEYKVPVGTDLNKMIKPQAVEIPDAKPKVMEAVATKLKPDTPAEQKASAVIAEENQNLSKKGQYVVQLASFRYYSQAEKFRAKLLLKGFDAKIVSVSRGSLQWYRVMLGPFVNQMEAKKAQISFQSREHLSGMVKPVDV